MKTVKPKLGSVYQRGAIWWIKYHRNGRPIRESSESDNAADATRLLKRRQGEIVTGKFAGLHIERIKFGELLDDLLDEYRRSERKSMVHTESRIRLHVRPAFGDIRIAEFNTNHIHAYIRTRQKAEAKNATVNRELEILQRAQVLAFRCNPPKIVRVIYVPMLPENNTRTGFLDDAGYLRLREHLPEYLRPLFVVAYHVGNRLGELRHLQWPQVDLTSKRIRLYPGTTKNNKGRTLPIYGEMLGWLQMAQETKDKACPYVFQHEGRVIGEFRKTWATACKNAEVPDLLFHDLRRSAIRNMRRAGIPENVAMQISGHRTRSIFERYDIVNDHDLADAAAKMETRLEKSLGTILGTVSPFSARRAN